MGWKAAVLMALALGFGAVSGASASSPCARPLDGGGKPLVIQQPLDEPARVALSYGVFQALRDSVGDVEAVRARVDAAPACITAAFEAGGQTHVVSGGGTDLPLRWIRGNRSGELRLLLEGPAPVGLRPRAYWLVLMLNETVLVLAGFEGAPDEAELEAAVLRTLPSGSDIPLAMYHPAGKALSLYLRTVSGENGHIFGPWPDPDTPVILHEPDGRYFQTRKDGVALPDSGFVCPTDLGALTFDDLRIWRGADGAVIPACFWDNEHGGLGVYLHPDDGSSLQALLNSTHEDLKPAERPRRGRPPFRALESGVGWTYPEGFKSAEWIARRNGTLVWLRLTWNDDEANFMRQAEQAVRLLEAANTAIQAP